MLTGRGTVCHWTGAGLCALADASKMLPAPSATIESMDRLIATGQFALFAVIALNLTYWVVIRKSWPHLTVRLRRLLLVWAALFVFGPLIMIWLVLPIERVRQMNQGNGCAGSRH